MFQFFVPRRSTIDVMENQANEYGGNPRTTADIGNLHATFPILDFPGPDPIYTLDIRRSISLSTPDLTDLLIAIPFGKS